ncbi:MAG: MBL fold metallo-hydrolase [Candidatus Cloacimonetes bacterium]|nr:MBL fold metallo-hydrolase [Candidatus Cloacimonadota bacterium]
MFKKTALISIIVIAFSLLRGVTLMSWEFSSYAGNETSGTANVIAPNVSTVAPSGTVARGAGLTAATNGGRFNANNWASGTLDGAITGNDYMTFSIAPASGYKMALSTLNFRLERSGTGPNAFTFRSSIDGFTADIGTVSYTTTTWTPFSLTLTGFSELRSSVEFRMYGYGATGTSGSAGFEGTGTDLEIVGTVSPDFSAPVVATSSVTNVSYYGCSGGGNITSTGGSLILDSGVVIGTSASPLIGGTNVLQISSDYQEMGSFSVQVEGLDASKLYYLRAYATNAAGTSYGDDVSFSTALFPAPILMSPTSITNSSFKARWQPVVNAQNYRLDVASSPVFSEGSNTNLITEGFNSGATAPAGWTFFSITETYTSSSNYGIASPSIKFESSEDYVLTPILANPTSISFWMKGNSTSGASAFLVQEYFSSSWHTVANITVGGTAPYNLINSASTKTFALNPSSSQVKFSYTKGVGNVGLDDVVIASYTAPTYVSGYNNLTVNGTEQTVSGLTTGTEYYYRVRSYSAINGLSAYTPTESVIAVYSGIILPPANLAANAINSSTVALSWQQNASHDNVLLAYSSSNSFGIPTGAYNSGDPIPGGGTVIYKGSALLYAHNGVSPNTTYYYRAWSVDPENHYSTSISSNVTTPNGTSERIKVHYIDVKQGDSMLVQRGTHNYLIDSGKDLSTNKLITYLQGLGVTHLDAMLVTHPDSDHYAEFEDLLQSGILTVDRFIKNRDNSDAAAWARLMAELNTQGIPIEIVNSSNSLNWVLDTQILNPPPVRSVDNDNSIVFKMTYGNLSFLFTGDMEVATNNYITNTFDVNCDILKVAHHGSINGTTATFLNEATPAISIISCGNNSFGHPSYTVIDMLEAAGSLIYSTADDWNTWTGSGSNDDTDDDDIVLETDGTNVWKNGDLVWTKPGVYISTPVNISISATVNSVSLSWDAVSSANSYQVFGSNSPATGFIDVSASGAFHSSGGRVTWTQTPTTGIDKQFYYIKAVM